MRIRLGCEITHDLAQPVPMIVMLNVHYSRVGDLERPDLLRTNPSVPVESYRDSFGNWCTRLVAPAGRFTVATDSVIRDSGLPDPVTPDAMEHAVETLPADTLQFLLGSRYCETDILMQDAWRMFGGCQPGWARVQAIMDVVHNHLRFDYMQARATRTAAEGWNERVGVCRDFAHLAVTFCRCMNIPARYCTGYVSDIGQPKPWADMDFAAWMEVYLGGRWHVFDPRNNDVRRGRILIARGRDAADVPLIHAFGPILLSGFKVWTDEIVE